MPNKSSTPHPQMDKTFNVGISSPMHLKFRRKFISCFNDFPLPPEVDKERVVQVERREEWHESGQSSERVILSGTSDGQCDIPHPSQVRGAGHAAQNVVGHGVAVDQVVRAGNFSEYFLTMCVGQCRKK